MLEAGADAYTCKLPDAGELMARVRSRLCRAKGPEDHAATLYCCNQVLAISKSETLWNRTHYGQERCLSSLRA